MLALRAPLARGLTKLDRSLFTKTLNLAAASVSENKNISKYRKILEADKAICWFRGISPIRDDPSAAQGHKCLLLRDGIKVEGT